MRRRRKCSLVLDCLLALTMILLSVLCILSFNRSVLNWASKGQWYQIWNRRSYLIIYFFPSLILNFFHQEIEHDIPKNVSVNPSKYRKKLREDAKGRCEQKRILFFKNNEQRLLIGRDNCKVQFWFNKHIISFNHNCRLVSKIRP